MAKVCGWYICYQQGRTQPGLTTTHQQPGPTHPVHCWAHTTRILTLLGHTSYNTTRQHLQHLSIQKTNTQTNTSIGTATTTSQPNKVFSTPWHTGQKQSPQLKTSWTRNFLHIKTALHHCQFPAWALNQWEHKFNHPNQASTTNNTNTNNNPANNNNYKTTIVVPYISNTADKFKKLCKRRGIQVHFKGTNTLRTALGNPKDKDPKANQTGVIYQYQCPHINCSSSYIGESGRSLGERVKEHLKAPSPIHLHSATSGHPLDPNQFNIVHKEVNSQSRTIKEAMFICIQDPPLNRNLGKYQLLHIWDQLLHASPMFHCKPTQQPTTTANP